MSYMKAYESALNIARNKANGGELSELERSELEKSSKDSICNSSSISSKSLGMGIQSGIASNKYVIHSIV